MHQSVYQQIHKEGCRHKQTNVRKDIILFQRLNEESQIIEQYNGHNQPSIIKNTLEKCITVPM